MENFLACDRCSFFLAGYRVLHGLEDIEQAVETSDGDWLMLSWDTRTRELLQKSYGGRLDIEFFYFDSQCPVCQRRYVYASPLEEGGIEEFRVEIKR